MPEEFLREIRKLEARLREYISEEEAFVSELRTCISKLMELNRSLDESKDAESIKKLRVEAVRCLSDAMRQEGRSEHERSHLLESYGAILLRILQ
jgi:hypothetical protein